MEANAIRILRAQKGWRQKDLAERANLTQARVSLLENGWKPRPDEVDALERAFDFKPDNQDEG